MKKIVAGIVTYNPDLKRLSENISAVKTQVEEVIIVDNGSVNTNDIDSCCKTSKGVLIINKENLGIARALNQIFEYTRNKYGKEAYVLTLDQDSVVYPNIISIYENYIDLEKVASISSLREDRNYPINVEENQSKPEFEYVSKCITSGNLVSLSVWEELGGFDETLFIDMVDSDFCYRMRISGYQIIRVNKIELTHELGNAFTVRFFGKNRTILNHSAFRRYYIFRNTIYVLRKYSMARDDYSYYELLKSFLCILLYEKDKKQKIKQSIKGATEGFKMVIDK